MGTFPIHFGGDGGKELLHLIFYINHFNEPCLNQQDIPKTKTATFIFEFKRFLILGSEYSEFFELYSPQWKLHQG